MLIPWQLLDSKEGINLRQVVLIIECLMKIILVPQLGVPLQQIQTTNLLPFAIKVSTMVFPPTVFSRIAIQMEDLIPDQIPVLEAQGLILVTMEAASIKGKSVVVAHHQFIMSDKTR
jgi:hypothetical protein